MGVDRDRPSADSSSNDHEPPDDAEPVAGTEASPAAAAPQSDAGGRVEVGRRMAGLGFVAAGVGLVVAAAALAIDDGTGIAVALWAAAVFVSAAGALGGLLGVWQHDARDSQVARTGVLVTAGSVVGLAGLAVVGSVTGVGDGLVVAGTACVLGLPTGLTALGVGLRRSVGTVAWASLASASPLTIVAAAVLLVGESEAAVVVTAGLLLLSVLTVVPLGVEMMRDGTDARVETPSPSDPGV